MPTAPYTGYGSAAYGSSVGDPAASYRWQQSQPGYYGGGASASSTPAGSYNQSAANTAAGITGYSDPTNGLTGQQRVDASRGQVFANTEGRGQATLNDPYTQAALTRFQGVANGTTLPYDATTKNALLTSASNASASAEGSQAQMLQQQLAMNGGSMNDPAAQAALRQLASTRQGANQDSLNGINQTANLANFDAQNQGAQQLAGIRSNQNAQANQMYLAGAGYRAQDYATSESPGGRIPMGNGMVGNQGYNPQQLPALQPYTPQPAGQAPAAQAPAQGADGLGSDPYADLMGNAQYQNWLANQQYAGDSGGPNDAFLS